MNKKYEFTGETKVWFGRTLHHIRACISFGDVKAGELGGWIEKEENLAQENEAWVYGSAVVYGSARVCDAAVVCGSARVCDTAVVCGSAVVYGSARVCDAAVVCGSARVCDTARVCGSARVCDTAVVYGSAEVCDTATVCGSARVCDAAVVCDTATVCGSAMVWRTNQYFCIGPIGSRLAFTTFFRAKGKQIHVKCGCFCGDIDAFARKVKATHRNNQHAKAYMAAIKLAKMQIDLTGEDREVEDVSDE